MFRLIELTSDDFDFWATHINRQRAESGKYGLPLFSPFETHSDFATPDRKRRFEESMRIAVGAPNWMRAWGFENEQRQLVAHLDLVGSPIETESHRATLGIGCERTVHRRGLGRALMEHALEFARRSGVEWIDLFVFSENEAAVALYRAFGFEEIGRRRDRFRVGGRSVDDVMMALRVA
jgi:ribosomal protein S18 acetylase RimI-like enzyme